MSNPHSREAASAFVARANSPGKHAGQERPPTLGVVSPELALVDPELARRARQQLPDYAAEVAVAAPRTSVAEKTPRRQTWHCREKVCDDSRTSAWTSRASPLRGLALALGALLLAALGFRLSSIIARTLNPTREAVPSEGATRPTASAPGRRARAIAPAPSPSTATPTVAQLTSQQVRTIALRGTDFAIGPFELARGDAVGNAVAVLGGPTGHLRDRHYCRLTWRTLTLRVTFYSVTEDDPCLRGRFVSAVIAGARWRTQRGLRIEDSKLRLLRLYPVTEQQADGSWSLRKLELVEAHPWRFDGGLTAVVRKGRVMAFRVS